jgi:catechol 2,3-dioxygenase-like lactoylglutathione lyase family enzyme
LWIFSSDQRTAELGAEPQSFFDTETYMYSHIMIGARDIEKMVAFYEAVLATLDLRRVLDPNAVDEAGIIWRQGDRRCPHFVIRRPINGLPATWGNCVQVSFAAPSRDGVDLAWIIAIQKGAHDEGAPGLRLRYAEDFYAAIATPKETSFASSTHWAFQRIRC